MTLYELTNEYQMLLDMAEDETIDEQALADTLEGLEGEIEIKADGYAKVMKQLEADAKMLKAEEERLHSRRQAIENNMKLMKQRLQLAMETVGKIKFKTDFFSFSIQKNPPSVILDEQYMENIPEEYLIYSEPTVNKKQLLVDLRSGKDLEGIAHLVQTESLRIR